MTDYKSIYYKLFNDITDIIKSLESIASLIQDENLYIKLNRQIVALRRAQIHSENNYINQD